MIGYNPASAFYKSSWILKPLFTPSSLHLNFPLGGVGFYSLGVQENLALPGPVLYLKPQFPNLSLPSKIILCQGPTPNPEPSLEISGAGSMGINFCAGAGRGH